MEEEKKEDTQEKTPGEGGSEEPSALNIVEQAEKVRDEIKLENDRREDILKQEQKLRAEQMLAGTGGGGIPAEKPKELTAVEYKDAVEKGEIGKD
jgi:hypothetical protein